MTKHELLTRLHRAVEILDRAMQSDDLLTNVYARDISNLALAIADYDEMVEEEDDQSPNPCP